MQIIGYNSELGVKIEISKQMTNFCIVKLGCKS